MAALSQQRCLRHAGREAVARCPHCGEFFCRECVTEHDDQVICAYCLEKLVVQETRRGSFWRWPLRGLATVASLVFVTVFFHTFGKLLVLIPSSFHEGSMWGDAASEDQK